MKKVGKYVAISLLLLLGLCCIGVLYLFFIPGSSLFTITYINNNKVEKSNNYNKDDVSIVQLNSRVYDVNIVPTDLDVVSLEVETHTFGFVLEKNSDVKISSSLKNNILKFDIKEPYGFATHGSSEIKLYLPKTKAFDLQLENEKAVTFINKKGVQLNNLSYSTNKGDLYLTEFTLNGDLKLNLNKASCFVDETLKTNKNNVELKFTKGKLLAEKTTFGDITILKNSRGTVDVLECNTLRENIKSAGGQITIKKVSHINVKASDTIIKLTEVGDGAIIDLIKSGRINITILNGVSSLTTKSGSIYVKNCLSSSTIHSNSGNITVKNAWKTISLETNTGDAYINFNKDASHYLETEIDKSRTLYARIHNGKLTAKGVEHVGSSISNADQGIIVTGKGRIELDLNNVFGENTIIGKAGNVSIVVNYEANYKLTTNPTEQTKGNVRVNLMQIPQYLGYRNKDFKETYVNCTASTATNSLTVSTTSGDLVIVDSKLN